MYSSLGTMIDVTQQHHMSHKTCILLRQRLVNFNKKIFVTSQMYSWMCLTFLPKNTLQLKQHPVAIPNAYLSGHVLLSQSLIWLIYQVRQVVSLDKI